MAVCICGNQLLTQILTHFYVLLGLRKKSSREISHLHRNVGGAGKALGLSREALRDQDQSGGAADFFFAAHPPPLGLVSQSLLP